MADISPIRNIPPIPSIQRPVYWECKASEHDKFWAAQIIEKKETRGDTASSVDRTITTVVGYILVRKWGAIGTKGQTIEQVFTNKYMAEKLLDTLIREKENKGYKPLF